MKVAFLDRDGTIISDYLDEEWKDIKNPEFLEGSIDGMKVLSRLGYELIIITNQYIINDGVISFEQYSDFTEIMIKKLKENSINLLDIFYCRHSEFENCDCKKPKNLMFSQALKKYNDIEVDSSIMIGDSECDKEFAQKSCLSFYGIRGGSLDKQEDCYYSISEIGNIVKDIESAKSDA